MIDIDPTSFCGPQTFAAITGCRREAAYKTLAYWKERGGWQPMPSTPANVLAAALMSRHYPIERWDVRPGGWIQITPDQFRRHIFAILRRDREQWQRILDLVAEHHDAIREPHPQPVQDALEHCRGIRRARAERNRTEPYTIGEWLRRRPAGTWVLFTDGHVSAARRGELITSDEPKGIHSTPLSDAWRVLRRAI